MQQTNDSAPWIYFIGVLYFVNFKSCVINITDELWRLDKYESREVQDRVVLDA